MLPVHPCTGRDIQAIAYRDTARRVCQRQPQLEKDRLNSCRYHQDGLGPSMPQGEVGQVEQRRSIRRTRVDDFEHGLEIAIQINGRPGVPREGERLISVIPPSAHASVAIYRTRARRAEGQML